MANKFSKSEKRTSTTNLISSLGIFLLLVLMAIVAVRGINNSQNQQAGSEISAADIAMGQAVYAENCASCHGQDLEGQSDWKNQNEDGSFRAPPHDETGHTWHHGDQYLLDRIRYGTDGLDDSIKEFSNMPAYDDVLTDKEIQAVLDYIKNSWPADIQQVQAERTQAEK